MNSKLERQKKDILDSINYAKRIQNAILPLDITLQKSFEDHFVFYKPKDIVAGDFYWIKEQNENTYFAVADCTGHGVPGAMMSVICESILSNIIKEKEIFIPNLILNEANKRLEKTLDSNNENIYDGMDISLISLNTKTNVLSFSGAFNSLFIIRNKELIILNADRQPIGKFHKVPVSFTNHQFNIKKGDCIYLFTDGYMDQFGGEKNKKMNLTRFKDLLIKVSSFEMEKQKLEIDMYFSDWQKTNFQVDDVCVVGIKI